MKEKIDKLTSSNLKNSKSEHYPESEKMTHVDGSQIFCEILGSADSDTRKYRQEYMFRIPITTKRHTIYPKMNEGFE